jgi:protein-tyrosine-phosphatase
MAEAVFTYLLTARCRLIVDTPSENITYNTDSIESIRTSLHPSILRTRAGTASYHVGSPPDSRSVRTCAKHGVPTNHRARQVSPDDFKEFDYLLAMDKSNLADLEEILEEFSPSEQSKLANGT